MPKLNRTIFTCILLALSSSLSSQSGTSESKPTPPIKAANHRTVVLHHAAWCHELYGRVEQLGKALEVQITALIAEPSAHNLTAARSAWLDARQVYGMTEALRFHDGPIEPLEPLINAWPIDEAYIDYVVGRPDAGIVGDAKRFPNLNAALLELANERGGEANICLGWHAIEFMLWGQDLSHEGPGNRPYSDFVVDANAPHANHNADRRCQYLRAVTGLLVRHLHQLTAAWAPGAAYRQRFEREVDKSIRRILTGATVLTAFELGGERMVVAYETRDQEQEHSCFSDNSVQDFIANHLGLQRILLGSQVAGKSGPGIIDLLQTNHPEAAAALKSALQETEQAIRAIPQPFDQAFLGGDESSGRKAMARAIAALETQTETLLIVGKLLGHNLPLAPGN